MDLRQLRHFVAVAEEGHFSRAARRANIVQSALSTSIRRLEEELGARLFVRTTRQVQLTEAGRVLLAKAQALLQLANEARAAVAEVAGLERGHLRLGAAPNITIFMDVPALVSTFHDRYPGIEIHLSQGGSAQLLEQLRGGELDLAILSICEPHPDIATVPIANEAMVLVCAPRHELAGRRKVPLGELQAYPFVDFEQGWATRQLIDRAFAEAGAARRTAFEVSDTPTLLALVERGHGVAILPAAAAEDRRQAVAVVGLAGPEIRWELVVACPRDSGAMHGAARAFLDLLSDRRR
ncbi:MAG TPA: LysR family transcriptional regulator [Sphingomicrobium sp.]